MTDTALQSSQTQLRPLTAMCVDDESVDLMLNKRTLLRSGAFAEVLSFPMAEDALQFFRENPDRRIDVIFLDVNMPRMNGFEFLDNATNELGAEFVRCIVIMLTTSLHPKDVERAEAFDMVQEYLSKPLTQEDALRLAEVVRALD